jgi:LysM repeat protein
MMFVAPSNKYNNSTGDFHFYKQHGMVDYKIQKGDTYASIARFFKIPVTRIRKPGVALPAVGRTIKIRVNVWSHKLGWATGPLLYDARNQVIKDPRKANRNYGYRYTKYCSSFCVKNKGIDVDPPRKSNVVNNMIKFL